MQNKLKPLVGFLAIAAFATTVQAVPTTFTAPTAVTGDSNVLNLGDTVLAFDVSGSAETVNGVSFTGGTTQNGVTLSITDQFSNNEGSPGTGLSTGLAAVLSNIDATFGNSPLTITLGNLTDGTTYDLRLFSGSYAATGGEALADGSATGTLFIGQGGSDTSYADLNFTAGPSLSQTLTITGTTQQFGIINALDLQAVPEPSTFALMGTAVAGLAFLVRRKSDRFQV
jgi:hypothetical protein